MIGEASRIARLANQHHGLAPGVSEQAAPRTPLSQAARLGADSDWWHVHAVPVAPGQPGCSMACSNCVLYCTRTRTYSQTTDVRAGGPPHPPAQWRWLGWPGVTRGQPPPPLLPVYQAPPLGLLVIIHQAELPLHYTSVCGVSA